MPVNSAEMTAKLQETLGLPQGWRVYTPYPFGSMDQQASRSGMGDQDFFVRENLIKIGPGQLRTTWDRGTTLYTAPMGLTIVMFFPFNIAAVEYIAVFLSDGTGVQVNIATQAVTVMSAIGDTFYAGGQLPACVQSGSQYLLIANNITNNAYWIWDGSILYGAGSLGPITGGLTSGGSGYSSAPAVTAFGGTGSGAIINATVSGGSVVSLQITNPGSGYLPGQVVQFAFSGGGSDSSAILQAALAMGTIGHIQLLAGGVGFATGTFALGISGGGGSGAAATYTTSGGAVTSINLTSNGSGYSFTPTITFPSGGGSGAQASAILSPASVSVINVLSAGSGYTSTPTLTIQGGGGSGATAVANMSGGTIASVTVTLGGSGYTSVPAVIVQSGINNGASATATLMPFGVSGSSIETFQGRVWLPFPNQIGSQNNGGVFSVSAPSSLTDFATSDGGLIFTSNDRFLRVQYTNIRQSNGYLYPFGDSSVSVISNVQTGGSPSTTTFNYQNTDPQLGATWRDSLQDYSRTILFANVQGVYGLYGGAVTKVSKKIDDIFANAVFPPTPGAITPASAVATIHTIRVYLLLMTITDPRTKSFRNVMLAWDENDWFIVSQTAALTYIATQEVNSNNTAWGTDGTNLFPLLVTPSPVLPATLSSKLYGSQDMFMKKQALAFYAQCRDLSTNSSGVVLTVTIDNEDGSFPLPSTPTFPIVGGESQHVWGSTSGDVYGFNLGFTLTSPSQDFTIENLALGCLPQSALFG